MNFWNYALRRLVGIVFVLIGVSIFTFILSHIVPGDPAAAALGDRAREDQIVAFRAEYGLDRPVPEQYLIYVQGLVTGDLGKSIRSRRSVTQDLSDFLPATVELSLVALAIAIVLGIPAGIWSAIYRNRLPDSLVRTLALIGGSLPIFWLGLLAIGLFYNQLGWLPAGGRIDDFIAPPEHITGLYTIDSFLSGNNAALGSSIQHLILPALVLGYFSTAGIARMMRSSMLEVLNQDYLRTARAKGLKERTVILRHGLRNALIPTLTVIGITFGGLLSGAVLTETVFSWPGIGRYATAAALGLDFPAIMGVTLVAGTIFPITNMLVDLATRGLTRAFDMAELAQPKLAPLAVPAPIKRKRFKVPNLLRSPLTVLGLVIIALFVFLAIAAPIVAPYDPNKQTLSQRLKPPSAEHYFGTDQLGRDVFSRIIWGARISLTVGLVVVASASIFGTLVGLLAGYFGGFADDALMRITDIFFAFPSLILAMAIAAALGPSIENAMIAIAIVTWPVYARLVRGQVLQIREREYVEAAQISGAGGAWIIRKHLLPNSLSPLFVQASLDMGGAILIAASLSFIGFGAQPPLAEWGVMISDGRKYVSTQAWLPLFPGLAILFTVAAFNLIGDGLRDALDPRLRGNL